MKSNAAFKVLTGFGEAYGSSGAFSQNCKEVGDVLSQSSWYLLRNRNH